MPAVVNVFTLGKRPAGFGGNHAVQATIRNAGSATLTNLNVSLNVTGANTYTNSQSVASLAAGATTVVTFVGFNPIIVGSNTVTVSVPSDDVNTNNSIAVTQTITSNTISTAYSATTTVGVGNNGSVIEFATKFANAGTKAIDQLTLYFPTTSTGQPYDIAIYDASGTGGTPGTTALWTLTGQTTAGANVNVSVSPALSISGDFFVAVKQTGTTNMAYGYEVENPIRSGTFYLKTTGAWTDFAPGNNFKLMMDARFSSGLPVSFSSFSGSKLEKINLLSWRTASETNNRGFDIERSFDGVNFKSIGFISSKANNVNASTALSYEFYDYTPSVVTNYYRLKQVDKDDKYYYSSIVTLKGNKLTSASISAIYPNPVTDRLTITIGSPSEANANLVISDINGKILLQRSIKLTNGEVSIFENTSNFSAGTFLLKLVNENGVTIDTKKIVKQ
jgi:hypothetical protein